MLIANHTNLCIDISFSNHIIILHHNPIIYISVEDVFEDILDKIEDDAWDSNTIATVRELTIEKFKALWKDVEKGVDDERRIVKQTGVEVDKKKCDFWKYKGVQDPIAPVFGIKASYAGFNK
jgi:hypothetical protein